MRQFALRYVLIAVAFLLPAGLLFAADLDTNFHNAPASAKATKNPYEGQASAAQAGKGLYANNCLSCHGKLGKGTGNVPSLVDGKLDSVMPGEVFWFITRGDKDNGMPSWAALPVKQRWQIVTYVKSMGTSQNCAGGKRARAAGHEHVEVEGTTADAAIHRLPLREARHDSQDYGERSAATVCHPIGG